MNNLPRLASVLLCTAGLSLSLQAQQVPTPKPAPSISDSTTPKLPSTWVENHEGMVADAKARAEKIQVVFLGDSITWRWTSGAGKTFYESIYAPMGAINLGISADSTQHVLWRLQHGVLDPLHPKVVVLMIGTNNLKSDPESVAHGVWAVVDQIRKTHPETRVLLCGIFPKTSPPDHGPKVAQVNALISKLDDGKMVKYIDFGDKFLNADGTLKKEWFPDGVHPEQKEAFQIWSDNIQPIVEEWIKTPPVDAPPPPSPVANPKDLAPSTADSRNDWLLREKRVATEAAKGGKDIVFIGDTVMSRWDRNRPFYDKTFSEFKPLNAALFGSRTENFLWMIEDGAFNGIQPKLFVIGMQSNLEDTPAANVAAGVEAMTKKLLEKFPTSKVLLLGALPRGEKPTSAERTNIDQFNTTLAQQANGSTVFFFDAGKAFVKADGSLEPTPAVNPPVNAAFERWGELQKTAIQAVLNGTAPVAP